MSPGEPQREHTDPSEPRHGDHSPGDHSPGDHSPGDHSSAEPDDGEERPEGRSLIEDLVDYGVYAPLGAAIRVAGNLPELLDKGRREAGRRITTARLIGRFAVNQARRRVGDTLADFAHGGGEGAAPAEGDEEGLAADEHAAGGRATGEHGVDEHSEVAAEAAAEHAESAAGDGPASGGAGPSSPQPPLAERLAAREAEAAAATTGAEAIAPGSGGPREAADGTSTAETAPALEELAIPNYGSLAASQVVPRLPGLSRRELEQVRRYEAANRRRRTVLNRIAQLQSGALGDEL